MALPFIHSEINMITKFGEGDSSLSSDKLAEAIIESEVKERIEHGEKTVEENWHNVERIPCGICRGSGYDHEDKMVCLACEGSGSDVEKHYGVEDMKMFAYCKQYGIDIFKEFCKACREAEAESTKGLTYDKVNKVEYVTPFKIPYIIKMNLMAEGYPVDEMMQQRDGVTLLARAIVKKYPEFMTTNRINF